MHDAARNGKGLARLERDHFTLKFNIEMPFHDQEKLVGIVMFMPVKVAFDDASDPGIVDLAQVLFHQGDWAFPIARTSKCYPFET